jgi:hypothetical protein
MGDMTLTEKLIEDLMEPTTVWNEFSVYYPDGTLVYTVTLPPMRVVNLPWPPKLIKFAGSMFVRPVAEGWRRLDNIDKYAVWDDARSGYVIIEAENASVLTRPWYDKHYPVDDETGRDTPQPDATADR